MPIVDITLLEGRSNETLSAIGNAVHRALVEHFGIPADDRFQVLHQKRSSELIYDTDYLGGPRSDNFVMVRITVGMERPEPVKHALYTGIVANLEQAVGMDAEDVFITLQLVSLSDLSVAGGRPYHPPHLGSS